jgi:hypothetical protein
MSDAVLTEAISRAIALIRQSPQLDDAGIFTALVASGIEPKLASRLAVFIPMAYVHVLLTPTGAQLPQSFQRRLRNGDISEPQPLASEPVWNEALAFAQREVAEGLAAEDILRMAGRTAELQAANQLLNRGAKLHDIWFTAPLLWPEDGPE